MESSQLNGWIPIKFMAGMKIPGCCQYAIRKLVTVFSCIQ